MQVVSNFTMGLDSPITLGPFFTATPISWLAPGMSRILLETKIPGADGPLINSVDLYPDNGDPTRLLFTMDLYNAIDTDISLSYLSADIFSTTYGIKIAFVEEFVTIVVPARSTITSPLINATVVYLGPQSEIFINVVSVLTGGIGDFPVYMNYTQSNVTAYIHH
jgi:hypothetical protein